MALAAAAALRRPPAAARARARGRAAGPPRASAGGARGGEASAAGRSRRGAAAALLGGLVAVGQAASAPASFAEEARAAERAVYAPKPTKVITAEAFAQSVRDAPPEQTALNVVSGLSVLVAVRFIFG